MRWIYISFAAFLLSILVAASLMIWGRSFLGADKAIIYFIILIPLALGSSLFLFKTVRSYAKLTGRFIDYKIELAGPVVIFFLVILLGKRFYQNPPQVNQDLTVKFEDPKSAGKDLTGNAIISYKTRTEIIPVTLGRGMFTDVHIGDDIKIVPKIQGYKEEATISQIPEAGEYITIALKKDSDLEAAVLNLKTKFLSTLNLYKSNAQDFGEVLKVNKERILEFDSTGSIEMEQVSQRYADAYFSLIRTSDSLIYLMKPYSAGTANQLDSLKEQALAIHVSYFLRYNDYVDNINEFKRLNHVSAVKKEIMIEQLGNLSLDILKQLKSFEKALLKAQNAL
jgi:hypothetical protein